MLRAPTFADGTDLLDQVFVPLQMRIRRMIEIGSLFGRLESARTPDGGEIGDIERPSCEELHDKDLLQGRSEDPKPGVVEFNATGALVKRLRSEAGRRIVEPPRGESVAVSNLRNGILERCPESLDAVDVIGRLTESEQREQGSADHHDALRAAVWKEFGDFDEIGPDSVRREQRVRHRRFRGLAINWARR